MIILVEKNSPFFDVSKAEFYFAENRQNLDDVNGFSGLLKAADCWNVYNNAGYVGTLFVYLAQDGRRYVGGYALRHRHKECVEALRRVCADYKQLWADTRHLNAVICLKKAGFKWANRKKRLLKYSRQRKDFCISQSA